jgi:DNA processing protein
MNNDLFYQIALTLVPTIGDVRAKNLVSHFGNATDIFKASSALLQKIEGVGYAQASAIKNFKDFKIIETEIKFIEKYKIQPLFMTYDAYPKRLLNCYDSPCLLYYKGNADLNKHNIVGIVGTRNHSEYGKQQCEQLVEDLKRESVLILSGLAFGIDSIAHKIAVKNQIPTVGVVAHGLDRIYPAQNKALAKQMTEHGGVLTDFRSGTNPDKQNFPSRNRIVAGMADAIVVVESGVKGGSLITAELANSYNKDVFAYPGKVTDAKSEGCNYLIKNNKASLITGAADLLELMNWSTANKPIPKQQRSLFIELTPEEKIIVDILQMQTTVQIDELYVKTGWSSSVVAKALLMLEMQGVVIALPGKVYRLN